MSVYMASVCSLHPLWCSGTMSTCPSLAGKKGRFLVIKSYSGSVRCTTRKENGELLMSIWVHLIFIITAITQFSKNQLNRVGDRLSASVRFGQELRN